jgi:hypothetical protein
MLWTIAVILLVLWLIGYFGPARLPSIPRTGSLIHLLLVIAVIIIVVNLLQR